MNAPKIKVEGDDDKVGGLKTRISNFTMVLHSDTSKENLYKISR